MLFVSLCAAEATTIRHIPNCHVLYWLGSGRFYFSGMYKYVST